TIRFPPQNKQTIAFEDLYPLPSENSYNSYIIQYHFEKDLNSQGKIKEIRGEFTHVSKGPGYKHSLYLKFPNFYQDCINKEPSNIASTPDEMNNCDESQSLSLDVSFETEILNSEDKTLGIGIKRKNATYNQLRNGFEILGDSSKTILASNSEKGKEFRKGYTAKVKFTFNKPISDTLLGEYPFDLFIKIINKKIDNRYPDEAPRTAGRTQNYYEIHLPGKYYNSEGKDLYLDNSNNPWALVIPGEWEWPLEGREFNLLGKKSPYPDYSKWVQAKGQGYNDWYLNPVKKYAFNLPEGPNSSLLAFLKEADSIGLGLSMAIISVSIFILILRKRFIRE
ncbi:MAG: LruC domain-containing protein, partial [Leptospiraceae bacterium]|nr:LruC domain-containing protein [Leptospiraceae bacterium]